MTLPFAHRRPMGFFAIMAVMACASQVAADTQSVRSGNWSNSATWDAGVPSAADAVTVSAGDTVTFDVSSARVSGVTVEDGATLAFHPESDATLETDENVLVYGRLEMRPQAPNNDGWQNSVGEWRPYFIHTLRFVDVDERAFVGGGMDPVASDVGLWVRGNGVLAIVGARKTGWTRLAGAARAGDTSIMLAAAPTGWRVGDVISIVPTEHPDVGSASYNGFDVRTIGAIDGARVVFSDPLDRDHPDVQDPFTGKVHTAEVLNLSRNVRIEGTGNGSASYQPSSNGRAHIHIVSGSPQSVRHAELVLLGPRGPASVNPTDGVPGRYPLHFHHSKDGSRGSTVEGVVVRQSGNRAFVPHGSSGITFRDTVAFDVWEDAYWWDPTESKSPSDPNASHDVLYDRAVAALIQDDPSYRGFALAGFVLEAGSGNECRECVAVGVQGNATANGFHWPSTANQRPNVWNFQDGNVSHNNKVNGVYVWQNDKNQHLVQNFVSFRNGQQGIEHGAYGSSYVYRDVSVFENGEYSLEEHAGALDESRTKITRPDGYSLVFEEFHGDGRLLFPNHTGGYHIPALFLNCTFSGIDVDENKKGNGNAPTQADFVACHKPDGSSLTPADVNLITTLKGMRLRVQHTDGSAYQIDHTGKVTTIATFYETDGEGPSEPAPPPPAAPAPTVSLTADPSAIEVGQSSSLTWSSTDADSCAGTGFETAGEVAGSTTVSPAADSTYTITCVNDSGNASDTATVVVESSPPPSPPSACTNCVESLTLVNADTNQDIGSLQDGDVLDLATLPSRNLNVRANIAGQVDQVVFGYDQKANYRTEKTAPYALAGDTNGNYRAWTPTPGVHTITVTPSLNGTSGSPTIVQFEAVD